MSDKSAENLARIRACDADWNENDHPRADNGQFTSGSGGGGAKVSKLQSGGKAKPGIAKMRELAQAAKPANVKNIKTLLSGPSSMNELFQKYKSDNNMDDASTVLELSSQMRMNGGDLFKAISEVRSKFDEMNDNGWMDDDAYESNIKSLDRVSGEAWSALEREKRIARGNKIGVRVKKYSDKTKGLSEKHAAEQKKQAEKINKAIHKSAMAEGYEKQKRADNAVYREQGKLINMQKAQRQEMGEAQKEAKKYNAAKSALAKARPGIQAMRQLAKSAAGSKTEEYKNKINADPKLKAEVMSLKGNPKPAKPTLQKLQQAMHSGSMMGDRAELHIDGQDYVKIGKDKWEHHPSNSRVLGGTFSSKQMMDIINKAQKVDLNE